MDIKMYSRRKLYEETADYDDPYVKREHNPPPSATGKHNIIPASRRRRSH